MTIEEKINKLQAELDQLKTEAARKEVSYNWEPKKGEDYYTLEHNGDTEEYINHDDEIDMYVRSVGNCFKTIQEAETYKEYLTVLQELRVFAREKNKGVKAFNDPDFNTTCYYIDFDIQESNVDISGTNFFSSGLPVFINEDDAEEAIGHFGDRLKILFTYNL